MKNNRNKFITGILAISIICFSSIIFCEVHEVQAYSIVIQLGDGDRLPGLE